MIKDLSPSEALALKYDWQHWARLNQRTPEGNWSYWVILAGRGFGKTRTGAEWIREQVYKGRKHLALCATTAPELRDIMIRGESGLLEVFPPHEMPEYQPASRRIVFHTGATAQLFSAMEPEVIRGHQFEALWADELAAWRYEEAWYQLTFCLRSIGKYPVQAVVTTTPKPTALVRQLVKDADPVTGNGTVYLTRGSTFENLANLSEAYETSIISKYEGSRMGRQELHAEILDDVEGALWNREMIDGHRLQHGARPDLTRIVVGVDPAGGGQTRTREQKMQEEGKQPGERKGDECGIVVVGRDHTGRGYVVDDCTVGGSPDEWAQAVCDAYTRWQADRVVVESNFGGEMAKSLIATRNPNVPVRLTHASRGKVLRAEPIASLYEQGRVSHVGSFVYLEDQMCTWTPRDTKESPDRVDALVFGLTELGMTSADWRSAFGVVNCEGCGVAYVREHHEQCPYCGHAGGELSEEVKVLKERAALAGWPSEWHRAYRVWQCGSGHQYTMIPDGKACPKCGEVPQEVEA